MIKKKSISTILTIFIIILLALCSNMDALHSLGQRATDKLYSETRNVNPAIKIITIDEKAEEEYGYFTSWSREHAAELIKMLNQPGMEPAVIGFDINYISQRDEEGDAAFAAAAKEAGNVVTASRVVFQPTTEQRENGEFVFNPFLNRQSRHLIHGLSRRKNFHAHLFRSIYDLFAKFLIFCLLRY